MPSIQDLIGLYFYSQVPHYVFSDTLLSVIGFGPFDTDLDRDLDAEKLSEYTP